MNLMFRKTGINSLILTAVKHGLSLLQQDLHSFTVNIEKANLLLWYFDDVIVPHSGNEAYVIFQTVYPLKD